MSNSSQAFDALPFVVDEPDAPPKVESTNWPAVFSMMLGVFGLVTAEFLPISLLTPIAADLGVSVAVAGQAVTATAVVAGISALLTGVLTRKLDRRIVLWSLLGLLAISSLVAATATSYTAFLVARLILGVALGGFWSMVGAIGLRLSTPEAAPRAISVIMAGVSSATVCAAPIGAYMGQLLGWQSTFYLAAAIGMAALALQLFALPRLKPQTTQTFGAMFGLLARKPVIIGFAALLFVVSGQFSGLTYIRPFLEQVPKFDVATISMTLLAFGVAGFAGNLLAAPIITRSVRADLILGALAISGTMLGLFLFGSSAWAAVVFVTLWGLAFGLVPVGFQSWAVKTTPDDMESIGGLLVAAFQVAITAGAAIGGVFVGGFGPAGAIGYAMFGSLVGALIFVVFRENHRAG